MLCAKMVEPIAMPFGTWTQMGPRKHVWRFTLAPSSEYDWTVDVWRRCGLMSDYFDHLLLSSLLFTSCHQFSLCVAFLGAVHCLNTVVCHTGLNRKLTVIMMSVDFASQSVFLMHCEGCMKLVHWKSMPFARMEFCPAPRLQTSTSPSLSALSLPTPFRRRARWHWVQNYRLARLCYRRDMTELPAALLRGQFWDFSMHFTPIGATIRV